jgi:hypothetical protein
MDTLLTYYLKLGTRNLVLMFKLFEDIFKNG